MDILSFTLNLVDSTEEEYETIVLNTQDITTLVSVGTRFLRTEVASPLPNRFLIQSFPSTRLVANQGRIAYSALLLKL